MRARIFSVLAMIGILVACQEEPTGVQGIPVKSAGAVSFATVPVFTPAMAAVGKAIFFDRNLSINRNQSCAACHFAEWGFTGPSPAINLHGAVYEGSIPGRFGDRKPPSSAYATPAPVFHFDPVEGLYFGGNFWDGRATGIRLGNAAAEQAQGPFLNPFEQGLRDEACVVNRVRLATYSDAYRSVFGTAIDAIPFPSDIEADCSVEGSRLPLAMDVRAQIGVEYDHIAYAIAAYEDSPEVNSFSSKYDAYLAGQATLNAKERRGLAIYEGKALCSACHPNQGAKALFTDFSFDNLGTPANPENPIYNRMELFKDRGLGAFLKANPSLAAGPFFPELGKMKVPTLRNVDRRPFDLSPKAYMHNGVFKSLEEVVRFYNTRDVLPTCAARANRSQWGETCWPRPEVPENVNRDELGNLGLTRAEESALVAFLRTLTDGWMQSGR
jgi:cytochrome c peroxidase